MSTPASTRQPWLHNAALDLLIGCGAWSLPLLAVTFFFQREHTLTVSFAFYLLAVFCNNPHYMATIYRAYHTAEDFNKYRFFTVYVTVLMIATVVLAHLVPAIFPWLVTLYLTWSPWHYTGQNFGIAQMFVRRTGAEPDPAARQWLYFSYAASFAVWFLTLHSTREGDPNFISLQIPVAISTPLQILFTLIFVFSAAAAFVRLRKNLPGAALLPPLLLTCTQLIWFVVPALLTRFEVLQLPASYFSAGALAFMHCAQYLWITSYYANRETPHTTKRAAATSTFSFGRYYLALIIGGIALFIPGPWLASRLLHHDFVESFLIFMALVNLHHFILDGAIWKLRDGRIARLLLGRNPPADDSAEADIDSGKFRHHLGWLFGPSRSAQGTRYALGTLILLVGIVDQAQYLFTQRDASTASLTQAELLNPHDTRVYFRRAQQHFVSGNIPAARTELERILAINPRNAPAQHLLGQIIFNSGDTAAALAHYDRMAELFRPDLSIALNRGLLGHQQGNSAFAVERFNEALSIAPHKTIVHFLLAEALTAAGRDDQACKQYELFITLVEESPGTATERDALLPQYFAVAQRLGKYYADHQDLEAAEKSLQRAANIAATLHHFDHAANLLNQLATVQEQRGNLESAKKNRAAAGQAASFTRS